MSEDTSFNLSAFTPYGGGRGARINVTSVSASAQIPGLEGGQQGPQSRVVVSNGGVSSAFVVMGGYGIEATTASLEILPGTKELLSPPFVGPNGLYIAAITASSGDATTINVCAGTGT